MASKICRFENIQYHIYLDLSWTKPTTLLFAELDWSNASCQDYSRRKVLELLVQVKRFSTLIGTTFMEVKVHQSTSLTSGNFSETRKNLTRNSDITEIGTLTLFLNTLCMEVN